MFTQQKTENNDFFSRRNIPIFLLVFWVFVWVLPWTRWLDNMPWLRTAIGLIVFLLPGMIASLFLMRKRMGLLAHFLNGFVLSVFFFGAIGVLGRIFHLSFDFIKILFSFGGGLSILTLLFYEYRYPQKPLYFLEKIKLKTFLSLFLIILFGVIINLLSKTTGDDQSYLAYLTSWRHSQALGFSEVYFGLGSVDSVRFWLAMFPMNLALLAELSNLHGLLLIGLYIEPFMVAIAILVTYVLYKEFLESDIRALSALLLHITFFFFLRDIQQTGLTFFTRLSEDKVVAAFIIAPLFFCATRYLFEELSIRRGIFFLFIGWSLALTHPVILAYSVFIDVVYIGVLSLLHKNYKKILWIGALSIVIILPVASLRFYDESRQISYDLEQALAEGAGIEARISYIEDTPFYGFNPERVEISTVDWHDNKNALQLVFVWSYVWILAMAFIWSGINIRKHDLAPFLFTTSLLVLLSLIPYTGWLIGYFVSARMLWRAPWLFPIGIAIFALLEEALNLLARSLPKRKFKTSILSPKTSFILSLSIFIISVGYFSVFVYQEDWENASRQSEYKMNLERLVSLGDYLEENLDKEARFVSPHQMSNPIYGLFSQNMEEYLPGLSSKSKVALFRFFPSPEPVDRNEINKLFIVDSSVTFQEQKHIMYKYQIEYILTDDFTIKGYYENNPSSFSIQEVEGFWIINLYQ